MFKKGHKPWNKGLKMSEEHRNKLSEIRKNNPVRYWLGKKRSKETNNKISDSKKGSIPWNKGTKGIVKAWNKGLKGIMPVPWNKGKRGIMPIPWNKGLKGEKSHSFGIKFSEERREKIRKAVWKGNNAGYDAKHTWIRRKKGYAKFCLLCGKEGKKYNGHWNIQWANIDHNYSRNVNDYIPLCAKCHSAFDRGRIIIKIPEYAS